MDRLGVLRHTAAACPVSWRVLVVESDAAEAERLIGYLEGVRPNWVIEHLERLADAVDLEDEPDVIVAAATLIDGSGLDLAESWRDRGLEVPVIILGANEETERASEAIRRGAYDFVVRTEHLAELLPTIIEKNLEMHRIREDNLNLQAQLQMTLTQMRHKNQQLEDAVSKLETVAATDPLTGLANRRALAEALDRGVAEAQRYGRDLACLMMDLDGFKELNDSAGHAFGDLILRELSRVLQANCRRSDCAGRMGGDEFVLLMPETDLGTARTAAERIREEFEVASRAQLLRHGQSGSSSVSVGLATLNESGCQSGEALLAKADADLYAYKRKHRVNRKRGRAEASGMTFRLVDDSEG
ncbi:diguanylate cyclase [Mucisphaera sp.]|uniref:GGDEF domain-containing response regulator n=1 Tax=Mucisphaera sp. TaxID=2913024 RepID=UPI003D13EF7D